jgi:hypothetical protein
MSATWHNICEKIKQQDLINKINYLITYIISKYQVNCFINL